VSEPNRDPLAIDREEMRELAHHTVDFLLDWFDEPDAPPVRRATPAEMLERLSGPAPDEPQPFDELLAQLGRDVLPFMSRVGHPAFFAFVPGNGTWPGALADFIASACNIFAGSWMEAAGPSQLELEVLGWFKDWIGYPHEAAGVLVTGGSAANLGALACAREAIAAGPGDRLVIYVADQAHSSIARAARILGMGADQVRVLPVDESFRLSAKTIAEAMDADAAAGRRPFALVANAGATNTGAIDRLGELATLCRERGVWLHADAAYGGFAVLTQRGKAELAGLELADSITLDPHKWLYQPFECGCLLVRDGRRLHDAFAILPDYLRDARTRHEEVNFSELSLQLTRTSRALKIWLSLHAFGLDAFRRTIDRTLDLAAVARERIARSSAFELMAPPSLGVVCFRRLFPNADEDKLDALNAGLVGALEESGIGLVSSTRLRGRYAIRLCVLNHSSTEEDVERVLAFLETAEPLREGASTYERHPDVLAAQQGTQAELFRIDTFDDHGEERRYAAGDTVVERWDTTRDFFVIKEGSVEVTIDGERVAELGPGEFFGELAALDWGAGFGYARLATVAALETLRVVVLSPARLGELVREHPALERELRRRAGDRLLRH
jgi:glutamate/tyrosine decarboxylase-like PLP-dependent enzyme